MVVIHEPDPNLASKKAMDFVNNQDADIIMKGLIDTKILLKAVVNTTYGIKQQKLLSHVGLLSFADLNHVIFVTDGAMNIAPTVDEKIAIIENAVLLAQNIGYEKPKVGLVSAVEKVNLKMQSTVDASDILTYYQNKEITFQIDGPFAIDNLVSHEAAKHKGITSEIAGEADILVFPNIESGNVFYKTSVFLAHAKSAGIICGAKVPIVLTSRADSMETKLHSIFLAVVM